MKDRQRAIDGTDGYAASGYRAECPQRAFELPVRQRSGFALREVKTVADELQFGSPAWASSRWRRDEMPWMPKGRYRIRKNYMPEVGSPAWT